MHSGGARDTVQLIAPDYQLHTYGAAVEQPTPTLARPSSRCCSCLLRPFLFSGAPPVARLDHTKCSAQERQQVLQEISRAWQTQVASDQHYRDQEALQAPLGLSALLITAHWVTDAAAAAHPTGISVPAIQVQLQWLVRQLILRCIQVSCPSAPQQPERLTVIYAHSMGDQLSGRPTADKLRTAALTLSAALDADVIVFEYPGYGFSHRPDGQLLKAECCCSGCVCVQHRSGAFNSDEACVAGVFGLVYDFVRTELAVPTQRIVLYGSSLGARHLVVVVRELLGGQERHSRRTLQPPWLSPSQRWS